MSFEPNARRVAAMKRLLSRCQVSIILAPVESAEGTVPICHVLGEAPEGFGETWSKSPWVKMMDYYSDLIVEEVCSPDFLDKWGGDAPGPRLDA